MDRVSASIDNYDLAFPFGGHINIVEDQFVIRLIVNVEVSVAVGNFNAPVAGAHNPTSQDHCATGRFDIFYHNGLLGGVEVTVQGSLHQS